MTNKPQSIMILGAGILQLPAIIKAREMGLKVIVADMDKNAEGFKYADVCLDISTIDTEMIMEAAIKYEIDGIMTLASDMPMITVAEVSKKMNLIGINPDTALKTTNKSIMRQALKENNVPIPDFFIVNNIQEYRSVIKNFEDDYIVKPVDSSASRGVIKVQSGLDTDDAFYHSKNFSKCGKIIVENFMNGIEVSVESLSDNGTVHIVAITDKLTTGAPYFVEMGHSQPSSLSNNIQVEIANVTKLAIKAVGIKYGPAHTEIIVTDTGPKVVEIGARLGGDNISTHLAKLSTGIDMVECSIRIALGKPFSLKRSTKGSAIRYFKTKTGRITSIECIKNAENIPGIKMIVFTKNIGDSVGEIKNSLDRTGFVIAQDDNPEKAVNACEKALNTIQIHIEKE